MFVTSHDRSNSQTAFIEQQLKVDLESLKLLDNGNSVNEVQNLFNQSKGLTSANREAFIKNISMMARNILRQILSLSTGGYSAKIIRQKANESIPQLKASAEKYFQNNQAYSESKEKLIQRMVSVQERIKNTHFNFDEFKLQEEEPLILDYQTMVKQRFQEDPFWAYKQMQIQEHMATAQMLSTVAQGVDYAFEKAFEGVAFLTSSACNMNESTKKVCMKVASVGKGFIEKGNQVLESSGIKESFNNFYKTYILTRSLTLPHILEEEHKIPSELSRKYAGNVAASVSLLFLGEIKVIKIAKTAKTASISRKTVSPKKLKMMQATQQYFRTIELEKSFVQKLTRELPSITRPQGFPAHSNLFYKECRIKSFKVTKNEIGKKGVLEGHLLYHPMENSVLFVIGSPPLFFRPRLRQELGQETGILKLIKSRNFTPNERAKHIVENALAFAESEKYKKVFFAWDPQNYKIASELGNQTAKQITGISNFSPGIHIKPLTLIEVTLEN